MFQVLDLLRRHPKIGDGAAKVRFAIVISHRTAIVEPDTEILMRLGGDDAGGLASGDRLAIDRQAPGTISSVCGGKS